MPPNYQNLQGLFLLKSDNTEILLYINIYNYFAIKIESTGKYVNKCRNILKVFNFYFFCYFYNTQYLFLQKQNIREKFLTLFIFFSEKS